MLKLKLQYFGQLMLRANSVEKTDVGKGWGQKEKEAAEDEMVGWHHWLSGHESEQIPREWRPQERCVLQCRGVTKSQARPGAWAQITVKADRPLIHASSQMNLQKEVLSKRSEHKEDLCTEEGHWLFILCPQTHMAMVAEVRVSLWWIGVGRTEGSDRLFNIFLWV